MQCPKCKKEIKNDSIFCEYCGCRVKKSQREKSYVFWKWSAIISFTSLLVLLLFSLKKSNNQEIMLQIQKKDYTISFLEEQIQICESKNDQINDSIRTLVDEKDRIITEQEEYIKILRQENAALRQVL